MEMGQCTNNFVHYWGIKMKHLSIHPKPLSF